MTLTPDEDRILDAALNRLIPDDGGLVAGGFVRERLARHADAYRAGLALLAARGFADRAPAAQDAVLRDLEGHPFFAMLLQHAMEGYYTAEAGLAHVGFRVTG